MHSSKDNPSADAPARAEGESGELRVLVVAGEADLRQFLKQLLDAGVRPLDLDANRRPQEAERLGLDGHQASAAPQQGPYVRRLPVQQSGGLLRYLNVEQIDWVEAANQYVGLHAGGRRHLVRESMARVESWLDPRCFVRVHRSVIVNLERVDGIRTTPPNGRCVVLQGGRTLHVSARYWNNLRQALLGLV
jgi:DNA-binding LytR/AlgR family response regulator